MTNNVQVSVPLDSVYAVYTGKANSCCCGCTGKYTYNNKNRDYASKNRGYEVQNSEICDSAVKRIYNQIVNDPRVMIEDGYLIVETETRVKLAFFINE
jgi:hypothetical protein